MIRENPKGPVWGLCETVNQMVREGGVEPPRPKRTPDP